MIGKEARPELQDIFDSPHIDLADQFLEKSGGKSCRNISAMIMENFQK
jgi:hypothetical protein